MIKTFRIALMFLLLGCSKQENHVQNPDNASHPFVNSVQWFNLFQLNQFTKHLNPYYPEVFVAKTIDSLNINNVVIKVEENLIDSTSRAKTKYQIQFKNGRVYRCIESIYFDAKMRWKRALTYYKPADGLRYPWSHNYTKYKPISALMGIGNEIFINTDIPLQESKQLSENILQLKKWNNDGVENHFYAKKEPIRLNADSLKVGTLVHLGSPTKVKRTAVKLPLNLWLTIFEVKTDSSSGMPLAATKKRGQTTRFSYYSYSENGLFIKRVDSIKFYGILLKTIVLESSYDTLGFPQNLILKQIPSSGKAFISKKISFKWD